ncbi:hypothetical protein DMR30_23130 [Klebsiella variicola]|nr:hypothetical protein DMR30_23130 [Klebsiella variicola]
MFGESGFAHGDLLQGYIQYAGRSLNVNGPVYRDAYTTLRRFAKIFSFTILFWIMFRLLPYDSVCPQQKYSTFAMAAIVSFHLLLTIACYWFIAKKITTKRIW